MNTLKALWANALLWLIRPALEEQQRRDDAYDEALRALLEEKVHKPHRERQFLEMKAAHEERVREEKAYQARYAARKAAFAARAAAAAEEANLQGESRRFYDSFPVSPASQFDTSPINQSK